MNCNRVEELLPLYVGHDLEEERTRLVTAHVHSCTECTRSAREYRETNQLLQQFGPPQFSEETYLAVRNGVLREIERQSNTTTLLKFVSRFFQPRLMWVVSTAVLLAVCLFAYYFIANRTNEQRFEQANGASQPDKLKDLETASGKDLKPALTGTAGTPPALGTGSRKSGFTQTVWHSRRAGEAPPVPVREATYSLIEPTSPTRNSSLPSDKTLRLEIQTTDRNIRIIWFSHPSTKEGSPSESSKGI